MNISPQIKGMVDEAGFQNVEHVIYKVSVILHGNGTSINSYKHIL
jgi:hypothetical protein